MSREDDFTEPEISAMQNVLTMDFLSLRPESRERMRVNFFSQDMADAILELKSAPNYELVLHSWSQFGMMLRGDREAPSDTVTKHASVLRSMISEVNKGRLVPGFYRWHWASKSIAKIDPPGCTKMMSGKE